MLNLQYNYTISPEVILNKYKDFQYTFDPIVVTGVSKFCCPSVEVTAKTIFNSGTTRVHLRMQDILSGGTNGNSMLTGLTIPILLTQSDIDFGFYTPFDGNIIQKEILNNFIFSSSTSNPYTYQVYNTSDITTKKFLNQVEWIVDWGDGFSAKTTDFAPKFLSHTYNLNLTSAYTISLIQQSPWGKYLIQKTVYVPFKKITAQNPKGSVTFFPQGGLWDSVKNPYNFIFTGDSENKISSQITPSNKIPVVITGFTKSRLKDLSRYGKDTYKIGPVYATQNGKRTQIGEIASITPTEVRYVIDGVNYSDFSDGTSIYFVLSSGVTESMISSSAITKDETLIRIVDKPQVWSDVFIERGKNSAFEYIQRLGEVDNLGDLEKYGYGFFNVKR